MAWSLKEHIAKHWLSWFGIVLSACLAFYIYYQGQVIRDPVVSVDWNPVEIVSASRVPPSIRILRTDNKPIKGDVYARTIYFWNAGRQAIRWADVLDTISLVLTDSSAEILDFHVQRVSRPVTRVTLERGARPNELQVRFFVLDHDDGFTAQVIYQGQRSTRLLVSGDIEGASFRWAGPRSQTAATIAIFVAIVAFSASGVVAGDNSPLAKQTRSQKALVAFLSVGLFAVGIGCLYLGASSKSPFLTYGVPPSLTGP